MTASLSRKPDGSNSRLDRFRGFTVAHRRLVQAKEALMTAIRGAEPNSLIFVFGPTGVGKTTLRLKTEQLIATELLSELQVDHSRVPFVSVEAVAPDSGSFNWRDHYKRLLQQLDEPLVDYKLNQHVERPAGTPVKRFLPTARAVGADYRYAVEQAVRYRKPVAVMIDEAQHLGKIASGRRLLDQLEVVKSIANQTKTVHVLFGTYDLLAFRNLNGQLSRRSIDIHFSRYRAEHIEDRQIFINIVQSFAKELPFVGSPDLVSDWEFLYERSVGCVGILKQWLVRAVTVALRKSGQRLTRSDLESQALSIAQCEQMHAETADGELKLNESSQAVARLRGRLGLSTHTTAKADPKEGALRSKSAGQASGSRRGTLLDKRVQMRPPYESWSLTSPPVPPRSQLYSLEPIGIGTGMVESLSGYVARLAEAHSVSVGDLVGRVLSDPASPQAAIVTAAAKAVRIGGHGFRANSYAINGITDRTAKWVDSLEAATTRRDLRWLTLLPFRYAIPDHLFRRRRAWCALCFEQWRANGQIVYEPLVWSIEVSSHCTVHARPLNRNCRHCERTLSPLGVFSRPGYCELCSGWLGSSDTDGRQVRPGSAIAQDDLWSGTQVEGLLAMLPRVNPAVARESFRRSLVAYLDQVTGGNVLALAQHIRCPHSILQNWLRGTTVPRLENVLRTCRFLNVPAASLFVPSGPTPAHIAAAKEAVALSGSRNVSPSRNASEIRQALLAALSEAVPRSLSEVARRLGYTNTERLYQADRKLCHDIAARYQKSGQSHWWRKAEAVRICDPARLKQMLEHSLKSNRPTSVHQLALSLGYSNDGYVHQKYPELCRAIGEKIALAKQHEPDKIRRTLQEALHENPAPTLTELRLRLGYSNSTVLRAHEPELCDQLFVRHRAHVIERRADLEKKAAASLTETPTPSLRDVCERLGITVFFMNKYFPAVRKAIAEKHRRWAISATAQRREKLFLDVHCIAMELHRTGCYPSVKKIVERLPRGSCREWKTFNVAVREARKTLGLRK